MLNCFIREEDEDQSKYPISKHPSSFIEKSRRKHLVDAVTAAVAARKKDEKEDTKNKPIHLLTDHQHPLKWQFKLTKLISSKKLQN